MQWRTLLWAMFCCYGVASGCVASDERPSWSLEQSSLEGEPSRTRREVTLEERTGCGDGGGQDAPNNRVDSSERVSALLELMKTENLDAYIVTSSDEHLSEYVSNLDKRRQFISGFDGSAGTAVVLADGRRALWTDGRYFLQADLQLDCGWILMKDKNEGVPTILEWLKDSLAPNAVVGADPKLISAMEWIDYEKSLRESFIALKPTAQNLVDEIWNAEGRSEETDHPIEILELQFAGKSWEDKVADVREELRKMDADMLVLTALDEIAWLFNLRGGDIPNNPVFKSYAIIDQSKIRLFIDKKIGADVDLHLHVNQCEQECVEIHNYKTVMNTLQALSALDTIKKVMLPSKYSYSGGASYAIYSSVQEEKRTFEVSPVLLMKSRKNQVERMGMRRAHVKDAVALIDFLSFLEDEINAGNAWDETTAATRLEEFRSEQENYRSLSFETISAFGSNGAVIHYKPSPQTSKPITKESPYLLDSGGQYKDGTTDVTRTLHYGTPTDFQKEVYTRVLKGALDVATLVFPKGTKDTRVDILARRPLFEVGLDYKHGTGHGIGMFLFIHEAPTQMRIYGKEEHDLEEGQFLSDEPGYYKAGDFGVRLETILTVVPRTVKYDEVPMLGFEPVTLVPFEPKMIDVSLLDRRQCEYINGYHASIREIVGPVLDTQGRNRAKAYMMQRTEPFECSDAGTLDATGDLQREQIIQQNFAGSQQSTQGNQATSQGCILTPLTFLTIALLSTCFLRR